MGYLRTWAKVRDALRRILHHAGSLALIVRNQRFAQVVNILKIHTMTPPWRRLRVESRPGCFSWRRRVGRFRGRVACAGVSALRRFVCRCWLVGHGIGSRGGIGRIRIVAHLHERGGCRRDRRLGCIRPWSGLLHAFRHNLACLDVKYNLMSTGIHDRPLQIARVAPDLVAYDSTPFRARSRGRSRSKARHSSAGSSGIVIKWIEIPRRIRKGGLPKSRQSYGRAAIVFNGELCKHEPVTVSGDFALSTCGGCHLIQSHLQIADGARLSDVQSGLAGRRRVRR